MINKKTFLEKEWYKIDYSKVIKSFDSNLEQGLSSKKVLEHRKIFGSNILNEQKNKNYLEIFFSQFRSPLIYVLLISAIIVFYLQDYVDSFIIFIIILVNALIGTIQEGKAQNTLAALKRIIKSYATVIRDGQEMRIIDTELVPGDIILLKDGDAIPADARLIKVNSLKVNESSMTGESEVVLKFNDSIPAVGLENVDQKNMVFRGTHVVSGLARAIVVRTGNNTIIGKIASKLSEIDITIPLKNNIDNLSKVLVLVVLFIAILLFFIGINTGKSVFDMFLTVVALSVSAIPEGLPVVVTLVLATGVWRMSKIKVLVKKMQAVEALGQAKIIALDKTGTITKNQMTLQKIFVNNRYLDVTGIGYNPLGEILENEKEINIENDLDIDIVSKICAFTSIATIVYSKNNNDWVLEHGDPTEAALLVFAKKMGYEKDQILRDYPQVLEIPFDIHTKHHSAINIIDDKKFFSSSGSPDVVLNKCKNIWQDGKVRKITDIDISKINEVMREFSEQGYRLLMLACDFSPEKNFSPKKIDNLTFVGVVAIMDAIRSEVLNSVKIVRNAGIKPVMITGDHKDTAIAIAKKVGIFEDGDMAVIGKEIFEMSDDYVTSILDKVSVFARVSPEDKMRIIELYKKAGLTIAMTGDGINDALSLTAADLGIAMGQDGTEVAKEAADIILLDDNFGNIVQAAEEGRNIYLTIKKSILFLLSTNMGEICVISLSIIFSLPLPIIATQIIWLNLVTDASLVTTLAFDKKEKNLLLDKYKKPGMFIVDKEMLSKIFMVALIMTSCAMFIFSKYIDLNNMEKTWTMVLTMLSVIQWFNIFNVRSEKKTVFSKNLFSNPYLLIGLCVAVSLHLFAVYTPFMQDILKLSPLNLKEWFLILSLGSIIIIVEEIRKYFYRRNSDNNIY